MGSMFISQEPICTVADCLYCQMYAHTVNIYLFTNRADISLHVTVVTQDGPLMLNVWVQQIDNICAWVFQTLVLGIDD